MQGSQLAVINSSKSRAPTSRWSRSRCRSWAADAAHPHRAFMAASNAWWCSQSRKLQAGRQGKAWCSAIVSATAACGRSGCTVPEALRPDLLASQGITHIQRCHCCTRHHTDSTAAAPVHGAARHVSILPRHIHGFVVACRQGVKQGMACSGLHTTGTAPLPTNRSQPTLPRPDTRLCW